MDILTHTLSGMAVGTVMASYSSRSWKHKLAIVSFAGLGGALPDIDAISMSSRFDGTLGKLFQLEHTGRVIYSAKFWYSHHAFMHSLLAALLFAILIGAAFWFVRRKHTSLPRTFSLQKFLLLGFVAGFVIHLLQDMITPASSWGGVRLFFPAEVYIGGTGDIWWWNNYNLFLTVVAVLAVNSILLFIPQNKKRKIWRASTTLFLIGSVCFFVQLKSIDYDFNSGQYADCEQKSKDIQREILGESIYKNMEKLDNSLKIHF